MSRSRKAKKPQAAHSSGAQSSSHETFQVRRAGTRGAVRSVPDTAPVASQPEPTRLAPPGAVSRVDLERIIDTELWEDSPPPVSSQSEAVHAIAFDEVAAAEIEAELGDSAPSYVGDRGSGQGQNEMMGEWTSKWSSLFLEELYRHYRSPIDEPCRCDTPTGQRFHCDDCVTDTRFCSTCLLTNHSTTPTHRISVWNGYTWSRTTLANHSLVINVGKHANLCIRSGVKDLFLGDITGFHEVKITYCDCHGAQDRCVQLLRASLWPCSTNKPDSAFTFRCLRLYDLMSTDAKLSGSRFHTVMQRQTNNISPHRIRSRLRELLRVARQFMKIQIVKRAGHQDTTTPGPGALALRCPACPRLDVNYISSDIEQGLQYLFSQQISYDGSFQLTRKNKAIDDHDISLTDGLLYWVLQRAYKEHLLANDNGDYDPKGRESNRCNNHRAASDTWVKQSGVAETGVGAVTCARHTFFMPQGCVNYWKGERYAYTDYAVASVMDQLAKEGCKDIGVFYDIFCQWSKNLWSRAPKILLPGSQLTRPARFYGGVPKYHLAAHIDSCYAAYSLNNMEGVGRLDAEGCERAWANLNQASGSTSEKGPGARIDSLNFCMNDWNWKKTTALISLLLKKWEDARKMAVEQKQAWLTHHSSLSVSLTAAWEGMSTQPKEVNGKWTSVFLMSTTIGSSRLRTVIDLNRQESARTVQTETTEPGFTAPSWISEGMDIERAQSRLRDDIRSYGSQLTDHQALDLYTQRLSLTTRIGSHRSNAALFLDVTVDEDDALGSIAEETGGQPENASLYLPSQLRTRLAQTDRSCRVKDLETALRRVECMETLRRLRNALSQKASLIEGKSKNARGEGANTRAQTMINRVTKRVDQAQDDYNRSFEALKQLGHSKRDLRPLVRLQSQHLSGLNSILLGKRTLGEGGTKLPWFWGVQETEPEDPDEAEREEFNEAMRVEWFRGRERFRRYEEEVLIVRRELASTLLDFYARAEAWQRLADSADSLATPGFRSYCLRQRDVFEGLALDGFSRSDAALTASPSLAICTRVRNILKPLLPPVTRGSTLSNVT